MGFKDKPGIPFYRGTGRYMKPFGLPDTTTQPNLFDALSAGSQSNPPMIEGEQTNESPDYIAYINNHPSKKQILTDIKYLYNTQKALPTLKKFAELVDKKGLEVAAGALDEGVLTNLVKEVLGLGFDLGGIGVRISKLLNNFVGSKNGGGIPVNKICAAISIYLCMGTGYLSTTSTFGILSKQFIDFIISEKIPLPNIAKVGLDYLYQPNMQLYNKILEHEQKMINKIQGYDVDTDSKNIKNIYQSFFNK